MNLIIHTDGGSRGNPGQGAIGVVIEKELPNGTNETVTSFGLRIGVCTNNEAEYRAVIEALKEIKKLYTSRHAETFLASNTINKILKPVQDDNGSIQFFLDSTLVVNQIKGLFKIKKAHLGKLLLEVKALEAELTIPISYTAVPREQNSAADKLLNQALDTL